MGVRRNKRAAEGVMLALREQTRQEHKATERTRLARAMARSTLTIEAYALHLAGLFRLQKQLETALARSTDPRVTRVHAPMTLKAPLLYRDLCSVMALRGHGHLDTPPSFGAASVGSELPGDGAELLGRLYVFEGSTLGGRLLEPRIRAALALPPECLSYYRVYGDAVYSYWQAFGERMNETLRSEQEVAQAVGGAKQGFRDVQTLFEAIEPEPGATETRRTASATEPSTAKAESSPTVRPEDKPTVRPKARGVAA